MYAWRCRQPLEMRPLKRLPRKTLHLLQQRTSFHPDTPATLPVSFRQKRCCFEQGAAAAAASTCALLPERFFWDVGSVLFHFVDIAFVDFALYNWLLVARQGHVSPSPLNRLLLD